MLLWKKGNPTSVNSANRLLHKYEQKKSAGSELRFFISAQ